MRVFLQNGFLPSFAAIVLNYGSAFGAAKHLITNQYHILNKNPGLKITNV